MELQSTALIEFLYQKHFKYNARIMHIFIVNIKHQKTHVCLEVINQTYFPFVKTSYSFIEVDSLFTATIRIISV